MLSVLSFSSCQYLAKLSTQTQTLPIVTLDVFSFPCYKSLSTNSPKKDSATFDDPSSFCSQQASKNFSGNHNYNFGIAAIHK